MWLNTGLELLGWTTSLDTGLGLPDAEEGRVVEDLSVITDSSVLSLRVADETSNTGCTS